LEWDFGREGKREKGATHHEHRTQILAREAEVNEGNNVPHCRRGAGRALKPMSAADSNARRPKAASGARGPSC